MPLERLTGFVAAGNDGSAKVLEQAGTQQEACCRRLMFLHGQWVDILLFGILRSEWQNDAAYRARDNF